MVRSPNRTCRPSSSITGFVSIRIGTAVVYRHVEAAEKLLEPKPEERSGARDLDAVLLSVHQHDGRTGGRGHRRQRLLLLGAQDDVPGKRRERRPERVIDHSREIGMAVMRQQRGELRGVRQRVAGAAILHRAEQQIAVRRGDQEAGIVDELRLESRLGAGQRVKRPAVGVFPGDFDLWSKLVCTRASLSRVS